MFYEKKYLKYKDNYYKLKNMIGGYECAKGFLIDDREIDFSGYISKLIGKFHCPYHNIDEYSRKMYGRIIYLPNIYHLNEQKCINILCNFCNQKVTVGGIGNPIGNEFWRCDRCNINICRDCVINIEEKKKSLGKLDDPLSQEQKKSINDYIDTIDNDIIQLLLTQYLPYSHKEPLLETPSLSAAAATQENVLVKHDTEVVRKPIILNIEQVAFRMLRIKKGKARTKPDDVLMKMLKIYNLRSELPDDYEYTCDECNKDDKYPRYNFNEYNIDFCKDCVQEYMDYPQTGLLKGFPKGFEKRYNIYSGEKLGV